MRKSFFVDPSPSPTASTTILENLTECLFSKVSLYYKYFCKYSFHELMQNLILTQIVKF